MNSHALRVHVIDRIYTSFAGLSQSVRDKVYSHLSQNHHAENGMVNVPIGGSQGLTSQDISNSQRGDPLQSYGVKIKDVKRRNVLGSESPASSPPPREVVSRSKLTQSQYQGDRYRVSTLIASTMV